MGPCPPDAPLVRPVEGVQWASGELGRFDGMLTAPGFRPFALLLIVAGVARRR